MDLVAVVIVLALMTALVLCLVASIRPFSMGKFKILASRRNALVGISVILASSFFAIWFIGHLEVSANPEKYADPAETTPDVRSFQETAQTPQFATSSSAVADWRDALLTINSVDNFDGKSVIMTDLGAAEGTDMIDLAGSSVAHVLDLVKSGKIDTNNAEKIIVGVTGIGAVGIVFSIEYPRSILSQRYTDEDVLSRGQDVTFGQGGVDAGKAWCKASKFQASDFCKAAI